MTFIHWKMANTMMNSSYLLMTHICVDMKQRKQCVLTMCNMWFQMNLIDFPLIGTRLTPTAIGSTVDLSTALVTGEPHVFNNAMLLHFNHSKLGSSENSTTEHSTRPTTAISHLWQLTLKMKTTLHNAVISQKQSFPEDGNSVVNQGKNGVKFNAL